MKHLREGQTLATPERTLTLRPEAITFLESSPSQRADMDVPFSTKAMSVLAMIAFASGMSQYAPMGRDVVARLFAERHGVTEEVMA